MEKTKTRFRETMIKTPSDIKLQYKKLASIKKGKWKHDFYTNRLNKQTKK